MRPNYPRPALGVAFLVGAFLLAAAGCSSGPVHTPVGAGKARETLRTALESWKRGDRADALQAGSPPIYVIDAEWQAGAKLVEYQVTGDGQEKDAHLLCPVQLTVREPGGKVVRREVTYVISTAPNLTVSRKLF
jgi:hypothetical protein